MKLVASDCHYLDTLKEEAVSQPIVSPTREKIPPKFGPDRMSHTIVHLLSMSISRTKTIEGGFRQAPLRQICSYRLCCLTQRDQAGGQQAIIKLEKPSPVLNLASLQVKNAVRSRAHNPAVLSQLCIAEALAVGALSGRPALNRINLCLVPKQEDQLSILTDQPSGAPRQCSDRENRNPGITCTNEQPM
jgi:hypothetical protein